MIHDRGVYRSAVKASSLATPLIFPGFSATLILLEGTRVSELQEWCMQSQPSQQRRVSRHNTAGAGSALAAASIAF
jgi:hypothetical protein